jgi:phosphatidate cytidylyltransferase
MKRASPKNARPPALQGAQPEAANMPDEPTALETHSSKIASGGMDRSLRNRLTFGPLMLIGLGIVLWLDWLIEKRTHVKGVGILALMLVLLPSAALEMARLLTAENVQPYRFITILGSGLLVVHAFLTQFVRFQPIATSVLAFIIVFVMLFAALRRAWARESQEAIVRMAGTVLATLYLGGLSWFLIALRVKVRRPEFISGPSEWMAGTTGTILLILVVVKSTDIGAYFGGKALGRHKLIRWLSPGKTWEGLVCGLITSGIVGWLFSISMDRMLWWKGILFGVLIGLCGQVGDLLESLMKRDAEVKDSGALIPGFGGILDIIDSPLFAAPFAYLLFSLF